MVSSLKFSHFRDWFAWVNVTSLFLGHLRPLRVLAQAAAPSTTRGASGQGSQKLQLLLLHSAFPHADEDAELFALRGNFTPEAAAIDVKVRADVFGVS